MTLDELRTAYDLSKSGWWAFWLHRKRSRVIATLVAEVQTLQHRIESDRWWRGYEEQAHVDLVVHLVNIIEKND